MVHLWIENVLPKDDPNWIKFRKYLIWQSIHSTYHLLQMNYDLRNNPMFKDTIPENEFNKILSIKSGEKVHYALILVNVYIDGLQKLKFTITKTVNILRENQTAIRRKILTSLLLLNEQQIFAFLIY